MKHLAEHQKGLLFVAFAALLWSSGGLLIKLVTFDAMQISFFRCAFASLTFFAVFRTQIFKANVFTLINSLFYASVLILYVLAMKATTAANAIFLQSTAPIYVLIFEPLLIKTKYEKINIISVATVFIGMVMFFIGKISSEHLEGNIFALLSGVFFAALFLGLKKNKPEYQFSSIFYGNVIVALVCIPFLSGITSVNLSNLWMVAFLGIFQIGFAYIFFSRGLKRVNAIEASLISLIEPVLNPVWVFLGYGEVPSLTAIIGGIIIISAISVRTFILEAPIMRARLKRE
jgi:drug/metabolite transporter (DMT)-like permease